MVQEAIHLKNPKQNLIWNYGTESTEISKYIEKYYGYL